MASLPLSTGLQGGGLLAGAGGPTGLPLSAGSLSVSGTFPGALPGATLRYSTPTYTGATPTPTKYGDFVGPDPANVANDPYYQFRAKEGAKGIQGSAASHGSLLSGGLLKSLEGYRQGLASEEAGKAFDRALQTYDTNRDTNAQNYGQNLSSANFDLGKFRTNADLGLGYGKLGLDVLDAANANGPTPYGASSAGATGGLAGYGLDPYAAAVESTRAANANASDYAQKRTAQALKLARRPYADQPTSVPPSAPRF